MRPAELFDALQKGYSPREEDLVPLMSDEHEQELFDLAHKIKLSRFGNEVRIRAILEFSNFCRRQCRYCGLNSHNPKIGRYQMEPEAIVEQTLRAWEAGYKTIVLQSGEDPYFTADTVCEILREIKRRCSIAVTLSLGERDFEDYRQFKACGADRYLLKHETADEKIYSSLHPCGTLQNRVACLRELKRLGYETGSGFMIGLPGQTAATIAKDLLLLRSIPCDMAGIGPFIPHPQTELKDRSPGSTRMTARAVAAARLLLPEANLPATTSLGVLNQAENRHVFSCGANVIMKKVTPPEFQQLYEIYPSPKAEKLDIPGDRRALEESLRTLGLDPV